MVAKIESGKSLIGALNYNERKVKKGKAKLIMAQLYGKSPLQLSFDDKLFRLIDLAARNHRTVTNTVHLSLNFDLSENHSEEKLQQIADSYMDKIGFGNQPFLVYQHFDAGHNHVHILTTNIEANGNRISLHNIGQLKSEPARKQIELEFGLVQAEQQTKSQNTQTLIKPLEYGKTDTKRAISNIVNHITKSYKFTSLPEFNAALARFNVMADRGAKETVMFNQGGLRYWALDANGTKTGVPIKASSLYKKPTLKLLNERFRLNEFLKKPFKASIIKSIDKTSSASRTFEEFQTKLAEDQIALIIRRNNEGRVYGLTFVDHQNKAVFNGSDLGKAYSASAIESRLNHSNTYTELKEASGEIITHQPTYIEAEIHQAPGLQFNLLNDLLNSTNNSAAENLFERKKKKKRRKLKL